MKKLSTIFERENFEHLWEKTNYYLCLIWMNSIGLIPSLIWGIYFWNICPRSQRIDVLSDLGSLCVWIALISLLMGIPWVWVIFLCIAILLKIFVWIWRLSLAYFDSIYEWADS